MIRRRIVIISDVLFLIILFALKSISLTMVKYLPSCIYAKMGIICPSCGGTSCVYNFACGNFSKAFTLHPIIFLTILYIIAAMMLLNITCFFNSKATENIFKKMVCPAATITYVIIFVTFGILRNFI